MNIGIDPKTDSQCSHLSQWVFITATIVYLSHNISWFLLLQHSTYIYTFYATRDDTLFNKQRQKIWPLKNSGRPIDVSFGCFSTRPSLSPTSPDDSHQSAAYLSIHRIIEALFIHRGVECFSIPCLQ